MSISEGLFPDDIFEIFTNEALDIIPFDSGRASVSTIKQSLTTG
jgi:hypothetical protein